MFFKAPNEGETPCNFDLVKDYNKVGRNCRQTEGPSQKKIRSNSDWITKFIIYFIFMFFSLEVSFSFSCHFVSSQWYKRAEATKLPADQFDLGGQFYLTRDSNSPQ